MVDESMAKLSLELAYSAIGVYTAAFVGYAAAAASTIGARADRKAPEPVLVGAGSALGEETARSAASAAPGDGGSAAGPVPDASSGRGPDPDAFPGRKAAGIATALTCLAFLLQLGAVIARAVAAQRVPWGNMHEFTLTTSTVVAGAFLVVALRDRRRQVLGVFVIPCVLLALGLSVTVLYVDAAALVPALQSGWLVVHVMAAMIATGAFALGALLSALFLVKDRSDRRRLEAAETGEEVGEGAIARLLPDAAAMDRLAYRINAFTFPLWTFAVIAGAIWAENAWGRYWGWDPKETWAFITWVVYAAYLHARATAGWKARGSSWIAIAGFGCLMFNYFGVNLFITGLHSYSGV